MRTKTASAGVGISGNVTLFGLEHTNPTGVRLRFTTQRKDDGSAMNSDAMRKQMSDMVDYMFEACGPDKRHLSPSALWEDFAVHHFDQKNLSVAWEDYASVNSKMGASVTLTARAGVTTQDGQTVRAGGSVGYGFTWNPFTIGQRQEKSGIAPILREDRGSAHLHAVTVAASVQLPAGPLPDTPDGAANSLGVPSVPIASATYMLGNGGFNATIRTLMERGRLSEAFTYRDLSERNINDFIKFANDPARRKEWKPCAAPNRARTRRTARPTPGPARSGWTTSWTRSRRWPGPTRRTTCAGGSANRSGSPWTTTWRPPGWPTAAGAGKMPRRACRRSNRSRPGRRRGGRPRSSPCTATASRPTPA